MFNRILILVISLYLTNCFYKNFERVSKVNSPISYQYFEIEIDKNSTYEYPTNPFESSIDIKKMKTENRLKLLKLLKESLFVKNINLSKNSKETILINYKIEREMFSYLNLLFHSISCAFIPIKFVENHSAEVMIFKNETKIYESKREYIVKVYYTPWFFLLLNFYDYEKTKEEIFMLNNLILIDTYLKKSENSIN
jgi:hypothetical protein